MRKILNLVLVFVLSIVVVGIGFTGVKAEATEDVTITIHVHQYDGVYTNTGIGVWDGQAWNGWGALQSSVDDFGAVIVLNYTAAEINAVMDSIQFEITSESVAGAGGDDAAAQAGILSPGDGKTFLDVTTLKDGSATTLEVYYVEGATGFVEAADGFGQIFFVYADPTVAANINVYDDWNMWTWNNGTLGTEAGDDGVEWSLDMVQNTGTYDVAMKLGVFNVAADADSDSGFIVRTADWAKQCGDDIMVPNDTVRGSGTLVYYYQAGSCDLETDGPAFLADIDMKFEMNAGNRFMETNMVTSPTTIDVELLMPQNPAAYDISRFTLLDSEGVEVPLVSVEVGTMANLGAYVSDVTCAGDENLFVLYVSSTLDHSLLGIVGSLQGWNPDNAVSSTKDDENGLAVFEICTTQGAGEYKVLYDPDNDGFTWDGNVDPNVTADNQAFDFAGERMGYYYIDANVPTVSNDFVGTFVSDFTPLEDEKTLIIHFDTAIVGADISVVGTFAVGWTPGAYISTKVDTSGYAVFEVPSIEAVGEFKILHDNDGTPGFTWDDAELTQQLAYDFGDADVLEIFINADGTIVYIVGGTAVATPLETTLITLTVDVADELQPGNDYYVNYDQLTIENHITVYVSTDLDHSMLGLVGSVQGWDIANAITSSQDSTLGYAVFEFVISDATGEFKIVYNDGVDDPLTVDDDESGFNWGDYEVTPGDNVTFEVGSSGVLVLYLEPTPTVDAGTFTSDFTPAPAAYGTDILFSEYIEGSSNNKAIEIYNPTGDAITLDGYVINIYSNGAATPTKTFDLAGITLDSGAVYVLCTDSYTGPAVCDEIQAYADADAVVFFNGNDALELMKDSVAIDVMGEVGVDESWVVGTGAMAEYTLVRAATVLSPNATFDPAEWVVLAQDTFTELGAHTADGPFVGEKTLIIHFDTALLGTEISIVGSFVQGWDAESATPYISTKVDSDGYAVFEVPVLEETGGFKILWDELASGTFEWADTELTPSDLSFDFNGQNVIEYVVNAAGTEIVLATGYAASVVAEVITDMNLVGDITQELFAGQYISETVESNALPYGISNNFVVADVTNEMGTYAVTKTEIALEFLNDPTSILASLELLEDGVVIPVDSIDLANPGVGTYTETVTCGEESIKLMVHIYLDTVVTDLAQLGLVGDVQGWDIGATIAPTGMDSNGNYVFEVCVDDETLEGAFKIKFDPDLDGFAWDSVADPEMTPGDILFDFDGALTTLYVEEGQSSHGSSVNHIITLANDIDVTKDYMLRFVDENGFIIEMALNIDNEAPEVQATFEINVDLEIDQGATFDLMDYFTQLLFLDNRDGEMPYVIVTDLDTSVAGEQTVVISATDMWNNVGTAEYVFTVIDVIYPIITLEDAPTLEVGDVEPNWIAFGATNEGTLVIDSSQIDMDYEGTYYVIYTATDAAGNVTTASLEVTVDAAPIVDPTCTADQTLTDGVCVDNPVEEPEDDTGCFGSIGNSSFMIIIGTFAVLGGAALFFIRKP